MKPLLRIDRRRVRRFDEDTSFVSTPPNRTQRCYRGARWGVATFFCLSTFISSNVAWAQRSHRYYSNDTRSAQGKEITYRGCLLRNQVGKGWTLVGLEERWDEGDVNTAFELVGDTSTLAKHGDFTALSVRGIELSPPVSNAGQDAAGTLEVKQMEVLQPVAEIDKSIANASHWIQKTDVRYGVRLAVPEHASLTGPYLSLPMNMCPEDTVDDLHISFSTSPQDTNDDGRVSVCVNTTMGEKDTYRAGKTIERINGFKYTDCVADCGVKVNGCSVYTFENHLSYRIEFLFFVGQRRVVERGCPEPGINEQQIQSFVRLFLSHVSFFRPRVPLVNRRPE
jgi:hypothetical protein